MERRVSGSMSVQFSRSIPKAAARSPMTPDLLGSFPVSRWSKRLVVPHDCMGPTRRSNKVGILFLLLGHFAQCPVDDGRNALHLAPQPLRFELFPKHIFRD